MKARRVALLRGINVGTAKRIAMADLRKLFETLGYRDVKTLLNSGNVVFTSSKRTADDDATEIEGAIAKTLRVPTRVTVLDGADLARAVAENPFGTIATDASRYLFMVLRDDQCGAKLKPLLKERWEPEAVAVKRRIAYLWCAGGIADSALWTAASRLVGDGGTARNLATMTKLLALLDGR